MRRSVLIFAVLVGGVASGLAQSGGIRWQSDPQQAVAVSQQTQLPLMCYMLGSSDDRDQRLERDQRRAMADPRVILLSKRFVPVRISRVRHRQFLEQLHLRETDNMKISFVAPDGSELGDIGSSGIANADALVQKMALVFDFHRQRMFDRELRPVLENKESKPDEIRTALLRVRDFTIVGADATVAALLDRQGIDKGTGTLCYEVLAQLSTKVAVTKLLERSAAGDETATAALTKCTPEAAEMMLEQLVGADGVVRLDIYRAVGKICRVKSVKADRWWEKAKDRLKTKEIERIRGLVETASKQWKAQNEYR